MDTISTGEDKTADLGTKDQKDRTLDLILAEMEMVATTMEIMDSIMGMVVSIVEMVVKQHNRAETRKNWINYF